MMTAEQLKNSILQLALQGKLVPQNSTDKKASDLLKEDQKNKKIKGRRSDVKQKTVSKISRNAEGEYVEYEGTKNKSLQGRIPFEIPDSWEWIHLGYVCDIARGGSPRPIKSYLTEREDGINWIKIGDSDIGGKYINSTKEKIIPEGMKKSRFVHAGDFLLTNSMSFGRPYILNCDGCIHDGWLVLTGYKEVYDKEFLYYMLASGYAFNQFCDVVSGAVVKNLNSDKVADAIFPVPPLEEQKRIVAKIEELMPFVEQYAATSTKLNTLNATFPEMMKKSILQEAVQGKLVPQDPNDEPASLLLERMAKNRKNLIKEKKIKAPKGLTPVLAEDLPYDIPDNWIWAKLGEVATVIRGLTFSSSFKEKKKDTVLVLRGGNIDSDTESLNYNDNIYVDSSIPKEEQFLQKGDCLIVASSGTKSSVGKSCLIEKVGENVSFGGFMMVVRPLDGIAPEIISYHIKLYRQRIIGETAGYISNITNPILNNLLIPLPPKEEQERIVSRVKQLLEICEKMKQ